MDQEMGTYNLYHRAMFHLKYRRTPLCYGRVLVAVFVIFVCLVVLSRRHVEKHEKSVFGQVHGHHGRVNHEQLRHGLAEILARKRALRERLLHLGKRLPYPEIKLAEAFVKNISSKVVNNFDFGFSIGEPDFCRDSPELVVFVVGAASHFRRRRAIRKTWANKKRYKALSNKIIFLVAKGSKRIQSKIETESKVYHDMIQVDFVESYSNLPLKSVAILKWTKQYCMTSKFILKTDDDVYVNMPVLQHLLKIQETPEFMLGKENYKLSVRRFPNDRYYVSKKEYPYDFFPPYLQGVGYVITTSAVPRVYDAATHLPLIRLEDVFVTGFCRIRAGVPLIPTRLFKTAHKPRRCVVRALALAHGYGRSTKLFHMHKLVMDMRVKCRRIKKSKKH